MITVSLREYSCFAKNGLSVPQKREQRVTIWPKNSTPRCTLTSGGGGCWVAKLCSTLATPWTCSPAGSLSMGFSRQEYWSGLPFPSPGDLSHPGIEPRSPCIEAESLPTELRGNLIYPREVKANVYTKTYTLMFIEALFLTAKKSGNNPIVCQMMNKSTKHGISRQ